MSYKIVSRRLGTPGDEWIPTPGVNIDALIAGGFIIEIGSPAPAPEAATVKKRKAKG